MGRTSDAKERLTEAVVELFWTGSYDGTTIDQICERAGVKKGTFYYFYQDKADLAEEALNKAWEEFRPTYDSLFSAALPPLERLRKYCDYNYEEQAQLKAKHGKVLGCPLCTLGTEVSTQESGLRKKVQAILDHGEKYLESMIRDLQGTHFGLTGDPKTLARVLHAYHLGLFTQARIKNDVRVLKHMYQDSLGILGVNELTAQPA